VPVAREERWFRAAFPAAVEEFRTFESGPAPRRAPARRRTRCGSGSTSEKERDEHAGYATAREEAVAQDASENTKCVLSFCELRGAKVEPIGANLSSWIDTIFLNMSLVRACTRAFASMMREPSASREAVSGSAYPRAKCSGKKLPMFSGVMPAGTRGGAGGGAGESGV
jgi:hypothetical protein